MTTLPTGLLLALATFANVFLLVFQQQNVHHRYLLLGSFTSAAISLCYVTMILLSIEIRWASLWYMVPSGIAGFLGSMHAHPRMVSRMNRTPRSRPK